MPPAPTTTPRFAIIIPVLNEAATIAQSLMRLQPLRMQDAAIVIADGGSADATRDRAVPYVDCVIIAPRGRAAQMNAGATEMTAAIFVFLHADTMLPPDALDLIDTALANSARQWGRFDVRFDVRFDAPHPMLMLVAVMMNLRSRLTGIATGDQAMFMTRAAFARAGGFPDIALMEDIVMSVRLKAISAPACLSAKVTTSARRWLEHGILRTILLMWSLRLRLFFGAHPNDLAREYGYRPRDE